MKKQTFLNAPKYFLSNLIRRNESPTSKGEKGLKKSTNEKSKNYFI